MRVLIVSQYFWPESFRINEVAKSLHQAGCTVTVLAGQPNYPDGVIFAGYAGNLGIVQALDSVLRAADLLRDEPDVTFVLVGSGSRLERLRREVAQRGLQNVLLPGRFPPGDLPAILSQASALLVILVDNSSMSQTVPSKVQTYLAVGRPIITALNGEGARVVAEAGAGLCAPAEDASELAAAVLQLKALPADVRARMGAAGRRYHDEHFDPGTLARRLIERFRTLAENDGAEVRRVRTHV